MKLFEQTHIDFVKWRWHAIALSLLIIVAGAVMILTKGLPLGVDFAGGTIVVVKFDQPVAVDGVRTAVAGLPGGNDAVVQEYGDASQHQVLIRLAQAGDESGGKLSQVADTAVAALKQANLGNFTVVEYRDRRARRRRSVETSGHSRDGPVARRHPGRTSPGDSR